MKILLIMPDAFMHKFSIGSYTCSLREAPLTLTTLAALGDNLKYDIEWKLIDGSVEPVPLDYPADLVGISVLTGCAPGAYKLSSHFQKRGIPVVLGGIHVTINPEEAALHADSIVVGMAEESWPELLQDFLNGQLKKRYLESPTNKLFSNSLVIPRRDLISRNRYLMPDSVQATRGCNRKCDFCTVSAVWSSFEKRPVADVVADVKSLKRKTFVFNDVSILEDREYAHELFEALVPLKKRWGGLATLDSLQDPETVSLMSRSGCIYILSGFESVNQKSLTNISKGFNRVEKYKNVINLLHSYNIAVQGCFVLGMDFDDSTIFNRTVEQVIDLKIDIPRYSIYTPYPGTPLFDRLQSEGRILSYNWEDYDTMHVVYRPALMSPDELYAGFKKAYRDTFKFSNIVRRCAAPNLRSIVNTVGGLTYRKFVSRLYKDPRYSQFCTTVEGK